jgi:hypothetical protein
MTAKKTNADKPLTMQWSITRQMAGEPFLSLITGTALRLRCKEAPARWWSITIKVGGALTDHPEKMAVKRSYNYRPPEKLSLAQLMEAVSAYFDSHVFDECADIEYPKVDAMATAAKFKPKSEYQ